MRTSIERLRVWLLVGAGLLVVVIAGFLGYAHLRAHRFLRDLPGRLGVDITRESNGFTYSQSSKGKTVYTIHAAKLVQRKDGKTTLRDVGIVLYGQRQGGAQARADRIYGSEFEYDQKAGVVRAMGEVHLDLQAPTPVDARSRAEYAAGRDAGIPKAGQVDTHPADDERMVHVKTSGLVFVQSLGAASTDQEIEFQYRGLTGRARGADFNSDTGVTVLQSEVRVSGLRDGQPILLTATHAEMDRGKAELTLAQARYVSIGDGAAAKEGGSTLAAAEAVVHLRPDGSVDRVLGSGGVSLEQAGGTLKGRAAEVAVSEQSHPVSAHVSGDVRYVAEDPLRQVQARAGQGVARFDGAGRIETASMTEAAGVQERVRASVTAAWNERTVSGERVEMRFATAAGNKQWMREGVATGGARMLLVDRAVKEGRAGESTSELRGDVLTAEMLWTGREARLSHVNGTGHTALRRRDANGGEDTSQGGALEVSFGEGGAGGLAAGGAAGVAGARGGPTVSSAISSAVQSGGVVLTHLPARRAGGAVPEMTRGTAAEARFAGDGQTLTLAGQAQVAQGDSLVRAETVVMRRDTGDATAEGAVKASYRQVGSTEPVHVVASRAELRRDSGQATFFGSAGVPARLWQGGSQVEAPEIEFDQAAKTLAARAEAGQAVHTVLAGGASGGAGAKGRPQVVRVRSRTLLYSDVKREAQFGGGVVLEDADGTLRSSDVVALLTAAGERSDGKAGAGAAAFMGGGVRRVTADGGVEMMEPGRRASGDRLVYTATDGMFVLTGTSAAPPMVVDEVQGTITGTSLRFHAGDNSVMVVGNEAKGAERRRVRTETQVRQR